MPSVIVTGDGLAITAIESEGDAPSPCCRSRFRGRLNTNVGSIARQTRGHSDGLYRLPRRGAEGACRESSSPGRRAWHSAMGGSRCRLYGPGSRDPAISLGRHIVDARLDLFQQFLLVERRPPQGLAHRRQREPSFGNKSEHTRCFCPRCYLNCFFEEFAFHRLLAEEALALSSGSETLCIRMPGDLLLRSCGRQHTLRRKPAQARPSPTECHTVGLRS